MGMIVIADDITGAAEMAGIALEAGLTVRLACGTPAAATDQATVIATDTRSMSETEAAAEVRRLAADLPAGIRLFKKTDSALRGHVVAELKALMEATGYRRAVYLPANPSKGRIIRDGVYYIDGTPIADTAFSYDPEFPARTSSLRERFPDAAIRGIIMPDAESADDIRHILSTYDNGHTLFAGAADLFSLAIDYWQLAVSPNSQQPTAKSQQPKTTLILCGSTQSRPLDLGIPVAPMPREVYDGQQGADYWFSRLPASPTHSFILTIPFTHRTGKAVAIHLRTVMAEMARRLVGQHRPDSLIIEGGATAWATLGALGWHDFQTERQVAPGVVQMSATNGTLVTLKPGSYPWGSLFQSFSE